MQSAGATVKYFFLSESWTTGRIWEFGGLWNEQAWNRPPQMQRQPLYIRENGENLWLYQTEDAVLMVEVVPKAIAHSTIGQVVLKRLLSAEQVIERLCQEDVFHPTGNSTVASGLSATSPADDAQETNAEVKTSASKHAIAERSISPRTESQMAKDPEALAANKPKQPAWQKSKRAVMARLRQLAGSAVS